MKDRVEPGEIDLVDLPHVLGEHGQPRMRRQEIAEPQRVEHRDVVIGARQQRLRELGADVAAAARDKYAHIR